VGWPWPGPALGQCRLESRVGHDVSRAGISQQSNSGETLPSQPSRTPASAQPTASSGSNPASDSSRRNGPLLEELDAIVDRCGNGLSTGSETTSKILESLEPVTSLTPATKEKAFLSYLAEIVTVEREVDEPPCPSWTEFRSQCCFP